MFHFYAGITALWLHLRALRTSFGLFSNSPWWSPSSSWTTLNASYRVTLKTGITTRLWRNRETSVEFNQKMIEPFTKILLASLQEWPETLLLSRRPQSLFFFWFGFESSFKMCWKPNTFLWIEKESNVDKLYANILQTRLSSRPEIVVQFFGESLWWWKVNQRSFSLLYLSKVCSVRKS